MAWSWSGVMLPAPGTSRSMTYLGNAVSLGSKNQNLITTGLSRQGEADLLRFLPSGYPSLTMSTLVQCVPNFSEGRNPAIIDAILAAMKMDGVYLLDREMDADHNRCVVTLAGEREALQEAAIRGVGKAAELIDLNQHQGAHPRLGAADVVPFIPIEGVSIEDCVAMAQHTGEQIWRRYQ